MRRTRRLFKRCHAQQQSSVVYSLLFEQRSNLRLTDFFIRVKLLYKLYVVCVILLEKAISCLCGVTLYLSVVKGLLFLIGRVENICRLYANYR